MKFCKDISFETKLMRVREDKIYLLKARTIAKCDTEIRVEVDYGGYYRGALDDTVFCRRDDKDDLLYINLPEAQMRQLGMRKDAVDKAYNRMLEAQNRYNVLINEYFNKPTSNPS